MYGAWGTWLAKAAADRETEGLRRTLHPREMDDGVLDLASNDYLGLAGDKRVADAALRAIRDWGTSSTGSRLVRGTTALHRELEQELAQFCDAQTALVFSSGYLANLGVVTALAGRGDLVVSDAGNHASLVDACRLSRARVVITPTGDVAAVRSALEDRHELRALVVTDAAFSGDGSLAPLAELYDVSHRAGALLLVDEAHSLGVHGIGGQGLAHQAGISHAEDLVRTVTLSKSLGSQGGAVLAADPVVEHVTNAARTFIFDTALAPASAGAALASLRVLQSEPDLPRQLQERAKLLASLLDLPPPASAVVPLMIGEADAALAAALTCRAEGVEVGCFRPPSVPAGTSRLRLTARATLSGHDAERGADVVRRAVQSLT